MLKIQEFISCFENIAEANMYLRMGLGLSIKEGELLTDSDASRKLWTVYLYNPGVHSNITNPLVQEANALILDDKANLVAKGPNHPLEALCPEELPGNFRLDGAEAEEMTDGTMVLVYNYKGEWQVATKDSADGTDYIPGLQLSAFTFEHEVKNLIQRRLPDGEWESSFSDVDTNLCFAFDYVSPHNRNIMPYVAPGLFLLSITDIKDGTELKPYLVRAVANKFDYPRPRWSSMAGGNSLVKFLYNIKSLSKGIILRDAHGTKVKIPNPIYYAVKSAKAAGERIVPTHIAKILCSCRDDTDISIIRSTFPEYSKYMKLLKKTREQLWGELLILWNATRDYRQDNKKFAEAVLHHPLNCFLFMLKDKKISSLKESVEGLDPRKLADLAEGKYEKEFARQSMKSLQVSNCGG